MYDASKAVDGNIATCMRTLDIGRTSPQKTVWWKVDLGEVYTINSINILFRAYNGYGKKFVNFLDIFGSFMFVKQIDCIAR